MFQGRAVKLRGWWFSIFTGFSLKSSFLGCPYINVYIIYINTLVFGVVSLSSHDPRGAGNDILLSTHFKRPKQKRQQRVPRCFMTPQRIGLGSFTRRTLKTFPQKRFFCCDVVNFHNKTHGAICQGWPLDMIETHQRNPLLLGGSGLWWWISFWMPQKQRIMHQWFKPLTLISMDNMVWICDMTCPRTILASWPATFELVNKKMLRATSTYPRAPCNGLFACIHHDYFSQT